MLFIEFLTEIKVLSTEFSHLFMDLLGCSPVEVFLIEFRLEDLLYVLPETSQYTLKQNVSLAGLLVLLATSLGL